MLGNDFGRNPPNRSGEDHPAVVLFARIVVPIFFGVMFYYLGVERSIHHFGAATWAAIPALLAVPFGALAFSKYRQRRAERGRRQ